MPNNNTDSVKSIFEQKKILKLLSERSSFVWYSTWGKLVHVGLEWKNRGAPKEFSVHRRAPFALYRKSYYRAVVDVVSEMPE